MLLARPPSSLKGHQLRLEGPARQGCWWPPGRGSLKPTPVHLHVPASLPSTGRLKPHAFFAPHTYYVQYPTPTTSSKDERVREPPSPSRSGETARYATLTSRCETVTFYKLLLEIGHKGESSNWRQFKFATSSTTSTLPSRSIPANLVSSSRCTQLLLLPCFRAEISVWC